MRTFFFIPPLKKNPGGLIVIYQIAEILHQSGWEVAFVVREKYHLFKASIPVLEWSDLALQPADLWVVPEGWPNALAPGLNVGCRNLVYVQNWAYFFSALPDGVSWNNLDVKFLSVSTPVAHFVKDNIGADSYVLRPGINRDLFKVDSAFGNSLLFEAPATAKIKRLNVAWMPRKNKAIAIQAMRILEARSRTKVPINWVEVHGKTPERVANILQSSHLFMGTGFPEGLGLPPLEAMACGAIPVTSAGYGGWDYLRPVLSAIPNLNNMPGFIPPSFYGKVGLFEKEALPQAKNAFIVPDADPISLALTVEHAANLIVDKDPLISELLKNGQQTADAFSFAQQKENVLALWTRLTAG